MHTFTTLAVLALAASTVSPVLSAPVQDNQAQARAELEERFAFGTLFKDLVRQGFLGGMFGLGQTATTSGTLRSFEPYGARDSSEKQHRDLSNLLTLAISSSLNSQNNNKRTPELGKPHVPGPQWSGGDTRSRGSR